MHKISKTTENISSNVQLGQALCQRENEIYNEQQLTHYSYTSRYFSFLLMAQWISAIALALVVSPKVWSGVQSSVHIHVLTAIFLGGLITIPAVILCRFLPTASHTRHAVAVAQMLTSALLIHLTGGRIETHFHVFASLAFLAFYKDRAVLVTATIVILSDHILRGIWFPYSVFGIHTTGILRSLEHAWWVIFEEIFLFVSIQRKSIEQRKVAHALATVEKSRELINLEAEKQAHYLNIHSAVNHVIAKTADLAEKQYELCKLLCALLSAEIGIFWAVSEDQKTLELKANWNKDAQVFQNFTKNLMNVKCEKGLSLLGQVWQSASPTIISNLKNDPDFPHTKYAEEANLHYAMVFPLLADGKVIGVMEFYRQSKDALPADLLQLFSIFSGQIARHLAELVTQAESQLAHEEVKQIKAALDQHAIVSMADIKGKITYVNDKFCDISKYAREELLGQDHRIVNSSHHSKEFMRELWQSIANGKVWHGEVKNKAKDGSEYWVATTIVPFFDRNKKLQNYISIRTDITQQKKNENKQECLVLELDRSNKELADFAYIVSHDLKAPLRGVNAIASWISTDYADKLDDEGREQLKLMTGRIDRMHALIEGILQFARVGQEKLETAHVDLQPLVESIFDFVSIPKDFVATIDTNLPAVLFEEVRIRQVFQNLISNAVKYMGKSTGEIHVGCRELGNEIQFYVRDTGQGIEEKYFQKIFQLFQTLQARDSYESTGVGLALIKKIIETKGGRVWVESVVGEGSTFWFTLPKKLILEHNHKINNDIGAVELQSN